MNYTLSTIKTLHVESSVQRIVRPDFFVFEGAVHILVDDRLSLSADYVELDKLKGTLVAENRRGSPVCLENKDFIFLSERLVLDFVNKTGYAEHMSIKADEGYICAERAQKLDEEDWALDRVMYSPCDAHCPHWHFQARRAVLRRGGFIRASNIVFRIGQLPIFMMPGIVLPIQGASKSGFLIPKFSYDCAFGFGLKQDYYWHINRHCDTTIGIDWRERRGIVFSDEFRWARDPDSFTKANWWYAVARNSFVPRRGHVLQATDHRYWFTGSDFRNVDNVWGAEKIATLSRIDFGTDKRIGYSFFNSLDDVDDTFNNSFIVRSFYPHDIVEAKVDASKTGVKLFMDLTAEERLNVASLLPLDQHDALLSGAAQAKKEREDQVSIAYIPHFEWNSLYKKIDYLGIRYRHDLFFDHILYKQEELEKFYVQAQHIYAADQTLLSFDKINLLRACYKGSMYRPFFWGNHVITCAVHPHMQFRSQVAQDDYFHKNVIEQRLFAKGAYRFFCDYATEIAFPEVSGENETFDVHYSLQPLITWSYIPKFYQKHWFCIDRRDRVFPKNEVALSVRNNFSHHDMDGDISLTQGVEFYKQDDIFYGRRGAEDSIVLPLQVHCAVQGEQGHVSCAQEYDWKTKSILQSEIAASIMIKPFRFGMEYVFQNTSAQKQRDLLSNIPHFLTLNFMLPCSRHTTLYYDSQFYSEHKQHFGDLSSIRPLLQRVRLDYSGHCWGAYIGFEHKKYREYGVDRSEKVFVFSLRLDSLGSFAKKFKGLPLLKQSE
ncbi:MAG: Organic solvent tolerance protein [candidate division TM6 bacterium GW2011_GWF2_38_10]|nr:MAG: Organic solvent tolerance protein [candidate division TM6 bacterium GW2011_GWF2_38_10]